MSRKSPRFVPPTSLVEITVQTTGSRFLLTPCAELNRAILAALGRALALLPVDLHAIAYMSNHWHALVSTLDALAVSRFVQRLNASVARVVKRLYGWDGSVFGKPSYIIVAPDAEEDRLRYILAQGAKEGLVRTPTEWPGVHCARALILEEVLVGIWRDCKLERRLRVGGGNGGGRPVLRGETEIRYPIRFSPIPSWHKLSQLERLARIRAMLREIEALARSTHPWPLGAKAICNQNPFAKPADETKHAASPIHTTDNETRTEFTALRNAFCDQFLWAKERLRRELPALLPPSCFPPLTPFKTKQLCIWSSAQRDKEEHQEPQAAVERCLDEKTSEGDT